MTRAKCGLALVSSLVMLSAIQPEPVSAQNMCGWYAIAGCFKQIGPAEDRAQDLGDSYVLRTNQIRGFAPGWWCVADGPYTARAGAVRSKGQDHLASCFDKFVKVF